MSSGKPFRIFSWHQDFMAPLAGFVLEKEAPARTVLVFPHARPAAFLYREIAAQSRAPAVMPRCFSLQEFSGLLLAELPGEPLKTASRLDCIALLYQAVQMVFSREHQAAEKLNFPLTSLELFMPWGVRLAALMEDFLAARLAPANLEYLEGTVEPFAALLLSGLSDIYRCYLELLQANRLTTPAQNGARLAGHCLAAKDCDAPLFRFCRGKEIVIAGFHLLSPLEEPLFHYLWKNQGAEICLHTDPNLLEAPQAVHWAAREHQHWLQAWKAEAQPAYPTETEPSPRFKLQIYEGFDLHSQLYELNRRIGKSDRENNTAVILPHSALLLPTLHSLSGRTVNISMGYPLGRSPLAALLESVLCLQEKAVYPDPGNTAPTEIADKQRGETGTDPGARYHWQDLLCLLHQPYLRMLGEARGLPMREIFPILEAKILAGERYISRPELNAYVEQAVCGLLPQEDQFALAPQFNRSALADTLAACRELLSRAFALLIGSWEQVNTLSGLCDRLFALCDFLVTEGADLWQRFPLDGEYLFRLKHSVVPALAQSIAAAQNATLDKTALFSLLRACLEMERVPFEAYPLEGIQIMGMLESRLLSFDNLFILDAAEDVLPGLSGDDSLFPDSLRREVGLPTLAEREKMVAHTFYRLVFSSRNVHIFYQTGAGKVGLLDEKKVRSRFIEELLWEEEKAGGAVIRPGEPPLFSITLPLSSPHAEPVVIERTPEINRAVTAWAARGISASKLDIYLECPLRFFLEAVAGLRPRDRSPDENDPAAVGALVHQVLEDFFRPYIGHALPAGLNDREAGTRIRELFAEHLALSGLEATLPHDALIMLREAGPARLADYLAKLPPTTILSLEKKFNLPFGVGERQYLLKGQVDRVDRRNGEVLVLDYKTGRATNPKPEFWSSGNPLWLRMKLWQPAEAGASTLLADLHQQLPSLQLPFYLFAFNRDLSVRATDAAFVLLRGAPAERGCEKNLLHKQDDAEKALIISEKIPALLRFVLDHLEKSRHFAPQPGEHCRYCVWRVMCGQA